MAKGRLIWLALSSALAAAIGFAVAQFAGDGESSPSRSTSVVSSGIEKGRAIVPWVVSGYQGAPFGDLAVAGNGTLYYIDQEYGQIDEVTPSGPRILLSSITGGTDANDSINDLSGLFVTPDNLWFTAEGTIFETTLTGRDLVSIGSALGAINLDVLNDGLTIYYTTQTGVYERNSGGTSTLVACGGSLGRAEWTNGEPATELATDPHDVVGVSASAFYFTTDDNELDAVHNGRLSQDSDRALDFFNGEMVAAPNGNIYTICGWSMCHITGSTATPIFRIPTHAEGTFVAPDALAIAPDGDLFESFTDQSTPNLAGILEMSPTGRLLRVVTTRTS